MLFLTILGDYLRTRKRICFEILEILWKWLETCSNIRNNEKESVLKNNLCVRGISMESKETLLEPAISRGMINLDTIISKNSKYDALTITDCFSVYMNVKKIVFTRKNKPPKNFYCH
ncbi:hypothetical protein CDIK_1163 [Cucumispora dikerogammari]|nr:hypothetical protein CDIK_1163 [Cucumispora dikerogammari]